MMTAPMESHCLRSSELPHTSKLYACYLDDFSRVARFYSHPPTEEGLLASATEVKLDSAVRARVVEILREQNKRFGSDASVSQSLDRLASGALAVVTGQQVGLFSGPAYSIYKALTAVRAAQHLTEKGTEAVPIFWLATEDHDLAEVNHTFWLGRGPQLQRLALEAAESVLGRSVGEIQLGEAVSREARTAAESLEGPATNEIGEALSAAYRSEHTYGLAFAKLMARVLAGRGVILLDPLDARLHHLGIEVYSRALTESEALKDALLKRNKELERAGFHAQVKVTERSTLLFLNVDGQRQPLRRRNHGFTAGAQSYSLEELQSLLEKAPELFSANALLRAVLQDALLPTAAYVGGPAEVAYFAQTEIIYRHMNVRMPAILPRAGFTLVEPSVARLLKKYGLTFEEILRGRQHVRRKMEGAYLPAGLTKKFAAGEKDLQKLLRGLRAPIGKLDKTLLGALSTAERKMLYQFEKLRGKSGRAQNARTGLLDTHERVILDSLFPHHGLQERSLNLLPFLARTGLSLLDELLHRTHVRNSQHQVLYL
ncbi:MAG: bacillithiol biosynthesis cysteine-adding enzyme BshC [Acidobacteria bacterium]|nr:bacillithiol biosynthesis cysteine-adding enzyme BshC [Acidobacteriota bacterium]MCL5287838.1 bacillithiol biosynthesis cysteine-adding enzyme BshC [Acidobacteriota bacterium]